MNTHCLKVALRTTIPVFLGYISCGIAFGLVTVNAGYPWWLAPAMGILIFAGAGQFLAVPLFAAGTPVLAILATELLLNIRHIVYGLPLINQFNGCGRSKPYLIFALTDETYSLLCDGETPYPEYADLYRFLVSLFNHLYWITGCVLGSLLGAVLPFSTAGIEFSMTALFIASFTEQWLRTKDHIPALTGLLATLLCLVVLGPENFLIPAMLLITLILTLLRGRLGRKAV